MDRNPGAFLHSGRDNSPGSYCPGPGWVWRGEKFGIIILIFLANITYTTGHFHGNDCYGTYSKPTIYHNYLKKSGKIKAVRL